MAQISNRTSYKFRIRFKRKILARKNIQWPAFHFEFSIDHIYTSHFNCSISLLIFLYSLIIFFKKLAVTCALSLISFGINIYIYIYIYLLNQIWIHTRPKHVWVQEGYHETPNGGSIKDHRKLGSFRKKKYSYRNRWASTASLGLFFALVFYELHKEG